VLIRSVYFLEYYDLFSFKNWAESENLSAFAIFTTRNRCKPKIKIDKRAIKTCFWLPPGCQY